MKRILRGKFIALKAYIRKDERSEVNNLSFYIRKLGEKTAPSSQRWGGE